MDVHEDPDDNIFDPAEVAEEIENDGDAAMDSGSDNEAEEDDVMQADEEQIDLQNDSVAHFDSHTSSIFCIAQHPVHQNIIATGGGDDVGYVFDSTTSLAAAPVLPRSFETNPQQSPRESLKPLVKLTGHTDSLNAIAFTLPKGKYLLSGGLDGQLRAYMDRSPNLASNYTFLASASEVPEINWLSPCPSPEHPDVIALGASDGSVWVYAIDASSPTPLTILQAYYLHTEASTAGAWTPDGKMLATVSEDGSFVLWDPFGDAAAAELTSSQSGQAVLNLTAADQRFAVEGGLYSVAIEPKGAFAVIGGAGGALKVVGLPRIGAGNTLPASASKGGAKTRKGAGGASTGSSGVGSSGSGQILASLQAQSDGIETLSFSAPPLTLLAAGSVDGSIVLFDTAHRFAIRRHIREAHEEFAVVKVEFVPRDSGGDGWLLTSSGMDGVVRRWDARGGTAAPGQGLVGEWRGHRGDGEGGGVLGFTQSKDRIVTAGDDGVALVFESSA